MSDLNGARLEGWKAIGSYLGRSDRVAQRWAADRGMPVRRYPGGRGGVYAIPGELDAWLTTATRGPEPAEPDTPGEHASTGPPPAAVNPAQIVQSEVPAPLRTTRRRWPRFSRALAAAGATAIVAVALAIWLVPQKASVSTAGFVGSDLVARDVENRVLWTRPLGHPVRTIEHTAGRYPRMRQLSARPVVADIDGDGRAEVLAVVGRTDRDVVAPIQELVCYSSSGEMRWRYTPSQTLAFGRSEFGPPWLFSDLLVTGTGASRTVWVSLVHSVWWPSMLVRFDAQGKATIVFINSGAIYAISALPSRASSKIMMAGVNNEYRAAMVAAFDPSSGPAVSPQLPGSDFVSRESPGPPLSGYTLLPRTEFNEYDGSALPYNWADEILVSGQERWVITLESETHSMFAHYRIGPDGAVSGFRVTDSADAVHRELEAKGALSHSAADCPLKKPREIRVFDARDGWTVRTVPVI